LIDKQVLNSNAYSEQNYRNIFEDMNDICKAPNGSVSFIQFVKEGKNGARPKARCPNKWYGRVAREMRRWREGEGEGKHIKERREVGSSAITCYRKGIMISPVSPRHKCD
jgi:hypothetical protein